MGRFVRRAADKQMAVGRFVQRLVGRFVQLNALARICSQIKNNNNNGVSVYSVSTSVQDLVHKHQHSQMNVTSKCTG